MCRVLEAEDEVTPLRLARIDAARGIGERIEYEVPADPAGLLHVTRHIACSAYSCYSRLLLCPILLIYEFPALPFVVKSNFLLFLYVLIALDSVLTEKMTTHSRNIRCMGISLRRK